MPKHIDSVVPMLVRAGSDIHAVSQTVTKLPHFPFQSPCGTPLHWALEFRNRVAAAALLSNGADPFIRDGVQDFTFSRFRPDFQPYSVSDIRDSLGGTHLGPPDGSSAMDVAIRNWDADAVEMLLMHAASSKNGSDGFSNRNPGAFQNLIRGDWRWASNCLRFCNRLIGGSKATQRRNLARTISMLKKYGIDIDERISFGDGESARTALMLALDVSNLEAVEALLDAGADVNVPDDRGVTGLAYVHTQRGRLCSEEEYVACRDQDVYCTTLLLKHGANINVSRDDGRSLIVMAMKRGAIGVASTLLRNGADITARDIVNRQPDSGQNVLSYLFSPPPNSARMIRAVHDKYVVEFLEEHVLPQVAGCNGTRIPLKDHELDKADLNGGTLLHYAASAALPRSCKWLLDIGADMNAVLWRRYPEDGPHFITPIDLAMESLEHLRHSREIYNLPGLSKRGKPTYSSMRR